MRVVFASIVVVCAGACGGGLPETELHVADVDGGHDRVLLTSTLSAEPRWSIDDRIVFMSQMKGDGHFDIFTIDVDGAHLTQLTHGEGNNGDPTWSPDGTTITFGSDREGGAKLDVFAMNADGSNAHALTSFAPPIEGGDTSWSGDGSLLTFEHDVGGNKQSDPNAPAEVWTMNADGSNATSTNEACSDVGCAPRFNPKDAHEIALIKSDDGVHHIYVMQLDVTGHSTGAHRLTNFAENEDNAWWSPDGTSLVFVRALDGAALYTIKRDGTEAKRVSPSSSKDVFPVWSPDGAHLAFTRLLSAPPT